MQPQAAALLGIGSNKVTRAHKAVTCKAIQARIANGWYLSGAQLPLPMTDEEELNFSCDVI